MNGAEGTADARPDPLDRIADHALRELYGLHAQVDLAARVVAAWRHGERGSDVSNVLEAARERLARRERDRRARALVEDDDEPNVRAGADPRSTASRRRMRTFALAATLLVALGAAAALWFTRTPTAPPLARTAEPVRVFRGAEPAELETRELFAGDAALANSGEVAWLDLARGGRVVLGPCGLLTGDGAERWTLERGRIELRDAPHAVAIEVGFAQVVAAPGGALRVELVVDDPALACSEVHGPAALRELRAQLPLAPRSLRVSVERGGAELEHDGRHETLSAGDEREFDGPAIPARLVTDEGRAELLARLDALRRGPKFEAAWWTTYAQRERELVVDVEKHLEKSPQYWPLARAEIARRVRDEDAGPDFARRCVDVALLAPAREGLPLVRALWTLEPAAFREAQIVVLAERGVAEFEREARAMVALHDASAGPPPLLAAAWLADQGDIAARALLQRALDTREDGPMTPADFDSLALTAFTLDRAGDERAWNRGLDRLVPEVRRVLGLGMAPAAITMALELRYFDEARRRKEHVTPARLFAEFGPYVEKHRAELADEEALSSLLEGMRR